MDGDVCIVPPWHQVPDFPGRPRGDWAVPGLSAVFQQANAQASFGRFGLQAMEELP